MSKDRLEFPKPNFEPHSAQILEEQGGRRWSLERTLKGSAIGITAGATLMEFAMLASLISTGDINHPEVAIIYGLAFPIGGGIVGAALSRI